jgi:hypothetical protein
MNSADMRHVHIVIKVIELLLISCNFVLESMITDSTKVRLNTLSVQDLKDVTLPPSTMLK